MALIGGIGSGKTTELLLAEKFLSRNLDAINVFVDLADYTGLNEIRTGAILASAGLRLYSRLTKSALTTEVTAAHARLVELAYGRTELSDRWRPSDQLPDFKFPVTIPGLFKPKSQPLGYKVQEAKELLLRIASPLLDDDAQITLLIDGLDRLIQPELFREFAEQDLRALKGTKISVIIVAPLLIAPRLIESRRPGFSRQTGRSLHGSYMLAFIA
jgi:hypothetical protein